MLKSTIRDRIPWPPLENLRGRNYDDILVCLEDVLVPVLNTSNNLSSDDANSLCIFTIKFLVESVAALTECEGRPPPALLASIIICCHVYLVLKDYLKANLDALTVPKTMYHILSKLTPEVSFHTHMVLGNLMLDIMEHTDNRTEGVAGKIIANSYSLLWNNALRFESLGLASPLQLCQLRFLALHFLVMKSDELEPVLQKAGMVLSVFGSNVKTWRQSEKESILEPYKDSMKDCLKWINVTDKRTKQMKTHWSGLWCSSFGENSSLKEDVSSALSLSEKFLKESVSAGLVGRKAILHFVLSQFRLLFYNGLFDEIPVFLNSIRDAVAMYIGSTDDETSLCLERLSCMGLVMRHLHHQKLNVQLAEKEIGHHFTTVHQWSDELVSDTPACNIQQFSLEVFRLLVRQIKTFTLKEKVCLTVVQFKVLMSIILRIRILLEADIEQKRNEGVKNSALSKEDLAQSSKSFLEAHRAWFILLYWAIQEDGANEFHQEMLNQADENTNHYMAAIDSTGCPELKSGERYYFGCMAVKLGHYFYDKQLDSFAAKLYGVACKLLLEWCRDGGGDMPTRMLEVSLLKLHDCAAECERRCGSFVQARDTIVHAFVLNKGREISEIPGIMSLIKTWVKITRQGWKEEKTEIFENCLGGILRDCKDWTFSSEHLISVLREELLCLETMSPRIHRAELAVLRTMEDISKDPSEKSSILLAISKTAWNLKEQDTSSSLITWASKKILELAISTDCHFLKGQLLFWQHVVNPGTNSLTKTSKPIPEPEIKEARCTSNAQEELSKKNAARKHWTVHQPCCLSDYEKTMKMMSCIKDYWQQGMTNIDGTKLADKTRMRWLVADILLCGDFLRCHRQYQEELDFLVLAHRLTDVISDAGSKVRVCTAMLRVLAALGLSDLPSKRLVHLHVQEPSKDKDKLANTLQLANFYLKAGQPEKAAELLKDKQLRRDCQSDALLRGMLSRVTGEWLMLPPATRGEGVGLDGGDYPIAYLMDAVRCHSTCLHRLLANNSLLSLLKAEGSFRDPGIWCALVENLESLSGLGQAYIHIGDTRRARCYLREALKLAVYQGLVKWTAQMSVELGRVYVLDEIPVKALSSLALSVACLNSCCDADLHLETVADILKERENLEFCRLSLDDVDSEDNDKSRDENLEERAYSELHAHTGSPAPAKMTCDKEDLVRTVDVIGHGLENKWKHIKEHGVRCSCFVCKDDGSLVRILVSQVLLLYSISKQLSVCDTKCQRLTDMLTLMDCKQKSVHTCTVCHHLLKECQMLKNRPSCLQKTVCNVSALHSSLEVALARAELLRDRGCPELVVKEIQPHLKMLEHLGRDFIQVSVIKAKLHYLMACALACYVKLMMPEEPAVHCDIWRSKESLKEVVCTKLQAILSRIVTSVVSKDEQGCDSKSQEAGDTCSKGPAAIEIVTSLSECQPGKKEVGSLQACKKNKNANTANVPSTRLRNSRRRVCENVSAQAVDTGLSSTSDSKDVKCISEAPCQPVNGESSCSEVGSAGLSLATPKQPPSSRSRNRLRLTKIPVPQQNLSKCEHKPILSCKSADQAVESVPVDPATVSKKESFAQNVDSDCKLGSKTSSCGHSSRSGRTLKPKRNTTDWDNQSICRNMVLSDKKNNLAQCVAVSNKKRNVAQCGDLLCNKQRVTRGGKLQNSKEISCGVIAYSRDAGDVFNFTEADDEHIDKPVKSRRKVTWSSSKNSVKTGAEKSVAMKTITLHSPKQSKTKGRLRPKVGKTAKQKGCHLDDMSRSPLSALDVSLELPRAVSDNENNRSSSQTADLHGACAEVSSVRRQCRRKDGVELSHKESPAETNKEILAHLQKAQTLLQHFPPVKTYQSLCKLLASRMLDHSPSLSATALLLESFSITLRHLFLTNFHRQIRVWQKERGMDSAANDEEVALLRSTQDDITFPWNLKAVTEILTEIPEGWTVCQFSLVDSLGPGHPDTLLLTRLSRNHAPFTVALKNFSRGVGELVMKEFHDIMQQLHEKQRNKQCEKMEWWSARVELDVRLQDLVDVMEKEWLGPWRCLLRAQCSDAECHKERTQQKACIEEEVIRMFGDNHQINLELLMDLSQSPDDDQHLPAILSHMLCVEPSNPKLMALVDAIIQARPPRAPQQTSPVIIILDRYLHSLPWENLPVMTSQQVCRMPSLASLHVLLKYFSHKQPPIVQPDNVFYVIDPDNNLPNTRLVFENLFKQQTNWNGIVGRKPSSDEYSSALTTNDLFIYSGHGSGVQYFSGDSIQQLKVKATSLLMGCSSVRLNIRSTLDPEGNVFNYILSHCPSVVGTLWDVTDRDIDRFLSTLLGPYLNKKDMTTTCTPLPLLVCNARSACLMRYLVGASTVIYGLPVLFVKQ